MLVHGLASLVVEIDWHPYGQQSVETVTLVNSVACTCVQTCKIEAFQPFRRLSMSSRSRYVRHALRMLFDHLQSPTLPYNAP